MGCGSWQGCWGDCGRMGLDTVSCFLHPQAQAGPETCLEAQSQQPGAQLSPNPTPSPLETPPRWTPGPAASPTSTSLSSPGKGRPGPG